MRYALLIFLLIQIKKYYKPRLHTAIYLAIGRYLHIHLLQYRNSVSLGASVVQKWAGDLASEPSKTA
jgi:hypothetical protein